MGIATAARRVAGRGRTSPEELDAAEAFAKSILIPEEWAAFERDCWRVDAQKAAKRTERRKALPGYVIAAAIVALLFASPVLYRLHHPVKLPIIGWIGHAQPAGDPGDCDPSSASC
jgi:hypothetical protein